MFKNGKKRLTLLLVSLSLILVAGVGVTLALIIDSTREVENVFTPSHVSCAVVEDQKTDDAPTGQVKVEEKTNVKIKNTGDTDAYIRAAIIVTWKNVDGTVWASTPVLGTDYTMNLGSGWVKSGDYYYYTDSVPAVDDPKTTEVDETLTGVLITEATQLLDGPVNPDTTVDESKRQYYLSIEIVASAIQSEPSDVVVDMWGVNPEELTN